MSEEPAAKRQRMCEEDLEALPKEELIARIKEQEQHILELESRNSSGEGDANEELSGLRESEEKLKQQQIEATRRENVLVMRLTTKEQELQDYVTQIQELKQAQTPSSSQLRSMLLDPAVNLMFQRMKKEMEASKEKLEQSQSELSAWKFSPDSQTGKRLMARCRMLLAENEELGKLISSGRTAKLEGEIALEKKLVEEFKQSQAETEEFVEDLDEEVEGMQSTICLLQQQLQEAKDQLAKVQANPETEQVNGTSPIQTTNDPDLESDRGGQANLKSDDEGNQNSRTSTPTYELNRDTDNETSELEQKRTYNNGRHGQEMEINVSEPNTATESTDSDRDEQSDVNHRYLSEQGSKHIYDQVNNHTNYHPHQTSTMNFKPADSTDASSSDAWSPGHGKQISGEDDMEQGEGDIEPSTELVNKYVTENPTKTVTTGEHVVSNGVENETVDYITDEET